MMQSAHSSGDVPTPGSASNDDLFDQDPFKTLSSSNFDDLALDDDENDATNDKTKAGSDAVGKLTNDELDELTKDIPAVQINATNNSNAANNVGEEEDPWAVLAAAAGTSAPANIPTGAHAFPVTSSAATIKADNTSEGTKDLSSAAPTTTSGATFTHAQGENFSIDTATPVENPTNPRLPPELAALTKNIQTSAAHLGSVISTKIKDVDERTEISAKVIPKVKSNFENTTRNIDEKIHVSEKWNEFKTNVWKPTTEKTLEKTREVTQTVGPSVKEGWGAVSKSVVGWKEKMAAGMNNEATGVQETTVEGRDMNGGKHMDELEKYAEADNEQSPTGAPTTSSSAAPPLAQSIGQLGQKAQDMKLTQKWASISSAVGTKWQSAAAGVGESVEHWKEEHKKKMATENAGMNGPYDPTGGGSNKARVDPVSAKVKESFAGGMGWVSKRFQEVKSQREGGAGTSMGYDDAREMKEMPSDRETKRTDSDGLPSSFFKE